MNIRRILVFLFRIPAAVFGSWTPPRWLRALVGAVCGFVARRPRPTLASVVFASALVWGGWQWWLWNEAHKPRPRELVAVRALAATVSAPAVRWDKDTRAAVPTPLDVRFDMDAAPLELVGKAGAARSADLSPAFAGQWTWMDARTLRFLPANAWPAGSKFKVEIAPGSLAANTTLAKTALEFETLKLTAGFTNPEFSTSPDDPADHKVVAAVTFSQPVHPEVAKAAVSFTTLGGDGIFAPGEAAEVTPRGDSPVQFIVRSPRIVIPKNEAFVKIMVAAETMAASGGAPLGEAVVTKVKVPTVTSGFHITGARVQLVANAEGEPQQLLFVECDAPVDAQSFAKAVALWKLPRAEEDWTVSAATPEVRAKSQSLKLTTVEEADDAKFLKRFVFRLPPLGAETVLLRVAAGTKSAGGFELGENYETVLGVPAYPKEARIVGNGGVLALNGERKLSIKSRGYDHLRFTLGRVPAAQINHLVSQTEGEFQSPEFNRHFGQENIARFHRETQRIAKKNDSEGNYSAFDFAASLAAADPSDPEPSRGLFFVEMEGVRKHTADDGEPDKDDPDPDWVALDATGKDVAFDDEEDNDAADRRFLLVTDLGLLVKLNADGTRDVFVQSFKSHDPVEGVRITGLAKNGESIAEAVTDAQGHAALPALDGLKRERKAVAIVARKGADLAFIPWERGDRKLELTRFDISGVAQSETTALDAFLFTERGIYRPGDSIRVGAIVRQRDWSGALDGVPVELKVTNAKEEAAGTFRATLNADGFIEFQVPTAESAPTGVWRVELRRAGEEKKKKKGDDEDEDGESPAHLGRTFVRVEDFQPDRMKMTASMMPATSAGWIKPAGVVAKADVQTLFGIAAAERRVTGTMRLEAATPAFEAWSGWRFHLPVAKRFEEKTVELTEQKSDAAGAVAFPLSLENYAAPLLSVSVDLEAFEPDGGRGVRGTVSALVSPHERLMGSKADGDLSFIGRDVPAKVRIVAIGPDLKPVAVPGLKRVLLESRHVSVLTTQDNGALAYISREKDREVETADVDISAGETELLLPTKTAGRFRYEWRSAGGDILYVLSFTVVGPGEQTRNLERDSELEVALPAREFRAGEELEVSMRAPYSGGGLITIERERVLGWQWFKSGTASSVQKIKIPDTLEGTAYVNVACVRGLESPEIFTNPLSVGVSPFRTTPVKRTLTVNLDVPQRIQPGVPLNIGYRCERASKVVIWAVDEGIHRVTNYRQPEPIGFFFRQRSLEVGTWQLMDLLLPEYSILKQTKAYGGDGDSLDLNLGLNPFKRKKDAPVVFWSGIVEGGPERREVRYDVPDYFAGRLNIMATAVALDAVGTTQSHTVVKGPFVLTPNAPFFVAPGDEFVASLTVANQTEGADIANTVAVSAEAVGGLEIVDAPKEPVAIAPNTETTVRFRVRTKADLGNAALKFSASAGKQRVDVSSTMSIRPVTPFTTEVQSGWFRRDSHEIKVGRALLPEFSKREAVVSSTPLGLNRGLEAYLDQYPHGCSEQITSKAFPWLASDDQAKAKVAVAHAIGLLARRQGPDGGFGYWSSGEVGAGFDYVSLYVAHFLTEAKSAGFEVPQSVFDGAMKRMKAMASVANIQSRHDGAIQAAAIYLLTRQGVVTTNYALNLRDSLEQLGKSSWHGDSTAAWLAGTWRLLKKDDEAKTLIAAHIKTRRESKSPAQWSRFYESPLTASAQSFVVICRHFPEIAGTFGYEDLKFVTEPIAEGRFDTLGAAWSVMAIRSYAGLAKDSGLKVGIDEKGAAARTVAAPAPLLVSGKFASDSAALQFLIVRPPGGPDLGAWYQAVEAGYSATPPTVAETRGLEVVREFVDASGKTLVNPRVGDTLRVRVRIRNVNARAQTHIAVSELFPGAFDLAPDGLRPGLHTVPGADYVDVREDRALFFTSLGAGQSRVFEYTVRPTCAGTYAIPPAFAEAMYDRAIHGTGVAGSITVAPRE